MRAIKTDTFKAKVLEVVSKIKKGQVLTYKQVATIAGNPKAARAVGNIMNSNYDPAIPCHRVIRSDGQLGGYNRGEDRKREILEAESRERSS